ncbi:hypothetical protein [Plasmodium yoelii yoelii]|uniref:Uncharacterized protein n=1 Tax=Plasmodium yoelii yoelii TaxID=73239 RepID=Q7RF70_PLAYO|nr:hypothetical protein [Plasmodium yoelii yoelii]
MTKLREMNAIYVKRNYITGYTSDQFRPKIVKQYYY